MRIIIAIPHYGYLFGLATSLPKDTFYVVNKLGEGELRSSDLSVNSRYWTWLRSIKPKPSNVKILGKSWTEIDQDNYDVAILIPDAGQISLRKYLKDTPQVFKFHLSNQESKRAFHELKKRTGSYPTGNYPCIYSANTQRDFYGIPGRVAWSQSPKFYKDWKGKRRIAMWTAERIGIPHLKPPDVRYNVRGGRIWDQVHPYVPAKRYGLDFRLGTPITPFEKLLLAYRQNRCYVECATQTILTDGLVEAMMTGMPSVVYANWEMDKIIEHGVNGFKSRKPKELIGYIQDLLKDYDLAKRIGKEGRKTAIKLWEPKVSEKVYHESFEEAIGVYNKESGLRKTGKKGRLELSTGEQYLLQVSEETIKELDKEFKKERKAYFDCPFCNKRYSIIHKEGEHKIVEESGHVTTRKTATVIKKVKRNEI